MIGQSGNFKLVDSKKIEEETHTTTAFIRSINFKNYCKCYIANKLILFFCFNNYNFKRKKCVVCTKLHQIRIIVLSFVKKTNRKDLTKSDFKFYMTSGVSSLKCN